jgi:hypothetical protein
VDNLEKLRRTVDDTLTRAGWPAPQWFETTPDDPARRQAHTIVADPATAEHLP